MTVAGSGRLKLKLMGPGPPSKVMPTRRKIRTAQPALVTTKSLREACRAFTHCPQKHGKFLEYLPEQCTNVIENKGLASEKPDQSGNDLENKDT